MSSNRFNVFEELNLDSDSDSDSDSKLDSDINSNLNLNYKCEDIKLLSPVQQACLDDNTNYMKKHIISNSKLNKNKKDKFLANLFDMSCNYFSINTMNLLIDICKQNHMIYCISNYITNNINYYFSESNEKILDFFISFDLDLNNNQSIFQLSHIKLIFKNLCGLGFNKLVKLMYNEYKPIQDSFSDEIYKYIKITITNGKFDILNYLCELICNHNDNILLSNNKIFIYNHIICKNKLESIFINYLDSLAPNLLNNKDNNLDSTMFYEISEQLLKVHIYEKFPFLLTKLLEWLSDYLFHEEYIYVIKKYFDNIKKDEKKFMEILNNLFENFLPDLNFSLTKKYLKICFSDEIFIIKMKKLIILKKYKLFKRLINLLNDDYKIYVDNFIINFLVKNANNLSDFPNYYLQNFINMYEINKNTEKFENIFIQFLLFDNSNLITTIYKNILKPINPFFVLKCLELLSNKYLPKSNYVEGVFHPKFIQKYIFEMLIEDIDLDNIIYMYLNNIKNTEDKMISLNNIDMLFVILSKMNKINDLEKIKNFIPDRYYYELVYDCYGFGKFSHVTIIDCITQSQIKQINWNKSNICKCGVCLGDNPDVIINCFHQYCKECIFFWYNTNKTCPYCRDKIKTWTKLNIIDNTTSN